MKIVKLFFIAVLCTVLIVGGYLGYQFYDAQKVPSCGPSYIDRFERAALNADVSICLSGMPTDIEYKTYRGFDGPGGNVCTISDTERLTFNDDYTYIMDCAELLAKRTKEARLCEAVMYRSEEFHDDLETYERLFKPGDLRNYHACVMHVAGITMDVEDCKLMLPEDPIYEEDCRQFIEEAQ